MTHFDKILSDQILEVLQQHGIDAGKPTVTRTKTAYRLVYPNGDESEWATDPELLANAFEGELRAALELCLIADERPGDDQSIFGWGIRKFLGRLR